MATAVAAPAPTFDELLLRATSCLEQASALRAQGLLIDRRADVTLPDGRKLGLDGFQIIDTDQFAKLDEAVVLDWHRKGWLALVHFQLASLERFGALLALHGQATTTVEPATKSKKA